MISGSFQLIVETRQEPEKDQIFYITLRVNVYQFKLN